jgi:hypothetical protein
VASADVVATLNAVANPFADALRALLAGIDPSCPVTLLVYAPIILSPALGAVDSGSKASPRVGSLLLSENIQHDAWIAANPLERLYMYISAFKAALAKIEDEVLPARFRIEIAKMVDAVLRESTGPGP